MAVTASITKSPTCCARASKRPRSTSASNAIAEDVKTRGGEVVGELEKLGKRRLAYEIDDVREGYYVVMHFKSRGDEQPRSSSGACA